MEIISYPKKTGAESNNTVNAVGRSGATGWSGAAERAASAEKTSAATTPTTPIPQARATLLADTLQLHGFKPTPENMQMLNSMLDAGIPLTKENITQMHQAYKMTQNMERALFLMQNNIPTTPTNASLLNALAEGQVKITQQIASLLEGIAQLQDSALQGKLIELLENMGKPGLLDIASDDSTASAKADTANAANSANAPVAGSKVVIPQNLSLQGGATMFASLANLAEGASTSTMPQSLTPQSMTPQGMTPQGMTPQGTTPQEAISQGIPAAPANAFVNVTNVNTAALAYDSFQSQSVAVHESATQAPQSTAPQSTAPQAAAPQTATPQSVPIPVASTPVPVAPDAPAAQIEIATPNTLDTPQDQQTQATQQTQPTSLPPLPLPENLAALQSRLSIPLQTSTAPDIENFINSLRETLAQAQIALSEAETNNPGAARVARDFRALAEHIDFANQIKNQIFVHVPLSIGSETFNTALYVNKDGKNAKDKQSVRSALIALDTAFLGHFETYLQKEGQAVRCQFRLENEDVENLVRANIHKLNDLLKSHDFLLESFTFLIGDKPFSILDALKGQANSTPNTLSDTVFDAMA